MNLVLLLILAGAKAIVKLYLPLTQYPMEG